MDPTNRSNWRGQRTRRLAVRAVVGFACLVSAPFAARAAEPADPEPIATFKIEEVFGVSHPDQVLTFDLDAELPEDGAHLVNGEGETVLFQILAKGTPVQAIAVRSGLPAHASRTWRLLPRAKSAPLPKDAVQVTQIDGAWEISNGRIGLRIARDLLSEPGAPRAVVQGVRLPSGEWAATGPNALHIDGEVTSANIELIEAGPLRVVVEARYELSADTAKGFQCNVVSMDAEADTLRTEGRNYLWRYFVDGKPIRFIRGQPPAPLELDKTYHALSIGDRQSFQISETPGGPPIDLTGKLDGSLRMQRVIDREGFYTQRIRIDAGQSSAFFTEHTDHDLHYELDLYDTVKPNLGRYRGHQARTLEAGRDYEGRRYTNGLHDQDDAFVDLTYDASAKTAGVKGLKRWPYLQQWNPWSADTGWYWMIYNAEDNAWNAPVVGVFSGRASKVRYGGYSGPTVFTYTEQDGQDGGERRAGYRVAINQRAPDTTRGPEVRIQWGLFVGMQSRDMAGPTLTQPINRQMNLFAGINLNKIKTWKLDAPPPAQGFGAMFMPREAVDKTIQRIRADDAGPQGDGYYGRLYSAEPTARDLLDMWADDSGDTARNELAEMKTQARQMLDKLVNGNGIYAKGVGYWHGGLAMSNRVAWIDQMLASKHLGAEQKTAVEQIAAFFGYLLWDNDHVPLFDEAKLNLGTPNMPVQQSSYRCMYALLLARHPDFAERAQQAVSTARRMLHQTVNEHGSQMGSSHYVHAAMGPLLNLLVQIKQTGLADPFVEEDRLRKFAEFYMQFATPPNPVYDNRRLRLPTGDAEPNEPQILAGIMGTAYADVDPELSARLMGAWHQSGRPHSGFHVSSILMIDSTLPQRDPTLGSAAFPGYMTVLRQGWGEPHESALWMTAGNWYRDHWNEEFGSVAIYAHAAPLAPGWGSMYNPVPRSGMIRSLVLPTGVAWQEIPSPHDASVGLWRDSHQTDFQSAPHGGEAAAQLSDFPDHEGTWHRRVALDRAGEAQPVFFLDDRFGEEAMIWSLTMTAQDEVTTPTGTVSVGEAFELAPGVSRLDFTGQQFDEHPAGGIDWRLFVASDSSCQGFLTFWEHDHKAGQRQVILRLKGPGPLQAAIVPWPKGQRPGSVEARQKDGQLIVEVDGERVALD